MLRKEKAPAQTGANFETNSVSNFTDFVKLIKSRYKRISLLCTSYIRNYRENDATLHHSQKISDLDGVQVNATLKGSVVFIVDKHGGTAQFSAYLVPEVRATLLEIEKKFGRRFIS